VKKKIFIAEDDAAIIDAMEMILKDHGYDVYATMNGDEVFALKDPLPDIFLLDIWMSGKDGGELCRELKKKAITKNIPIILVSANKDTEKIAKESGANDYLLKPFDMQALLDKIQQYTGK
jgi:DNA-binding response OmpR family regulator